jgi:hypothetical protein
MARIDMQTHITEKYDDGVLGQGDGRLCVDCAYHYNPGFGTDARCRRYVSVVDGLDASCADARSGPCMTRGLSWRKVQ